MSSFSPLFSNLSDPRSSKNQVYPFEYMMLVSLCSCMAGETSFSGIADYASLHHDEFSKYFACQIIALIMTPSVISSNLLIMIIFTFGSRHLLPCLLTASLLRKVLRLTEKQSVVPLITLSISLTPGAQEIACF